MLRSWDGINPRERNLIEGLENVLTVLRLGWESRKKLPILLFCVAWVSRSYRPYTIGLFFVYPAAYETLVDFHAQISNAAEPSLSSNAQSMNFFYCLSSFHVSRTQYLFGSHQLLHVSIILSIVQAGFSLNLKTSR